MSPPSPLDIRVLRPFEGQAAVLEAVAAKLANQLHAIRYVSEGETIFDSLFFIFEEASKTKNQAIRLIIVTRGDEWRNLVRIVGKIYPNIRLERIRVPDVGAAYFCW